METAWRITNGKIETFYKQTNEPMFVYTLLSQTEDGITVQMNGTLDDDLQATIILDKVNLIYSDDVVLDTKTDSLFTKIGILSSCAEFAESQIKLEGIRIDRNTVHSITPNTDLVRTTMQNAYRTINNINYLLAHLQEGSDNYTQNVAEGRAIRAFVYYNLAMLWGDVPVVTNPITSVSDSYTPNQTKQSEVYQFAYNEISEVLNNLPEQVSSSENSFLMSRDAGRMLKSELEMALGNKNSAKSLLQQIDKEVYEGEMSSTDGDMAKPVIWGLPVTGSSSYIPVYTCSHMTLLTKELAGETEQLETEWISNVFTKHGYWAALKRMGKAQSLTGCYDYELLMPFPLSDILTNPNMTQNPGY